MYTNAIRHQNSFLSKCRVVPITGISSDLMFYLELHLLCMTGVTEVLTHKNTINSGRYNVMTNDTHFQEATSTLRNTLTTLVQDIVKTQTLPQSTFGPPALAFRTQMTDNSSNSSLDTYNTKLSTIYTAVENAIDSPPASVGPAPQSWNAPQPIPNMISTPSASSQNTSTVTKDEFEWVKFENKQLQQRLNQMDQQMKQLLDKISTAP